MSNPAVSFRVTPQDRGRLDQLTRKTGKSLGQILREALGLVEREVLSAYNRGSAAGRASGVEEGRKTGLQEGKRAWAIIYYCYVCGGVMEVRPNTPIHQAVVDALHEKGWGHVDCHKRRQGTQ